MAFYVNFSPITSGSSTEIVEDYVASLIRDSTDIDWTYNDPSDELSASLTPTGVTNGSYGSATQVANFTVDLKGRLTSASNTTIAIPSTQITDFTEAAQDAVLGSLADSSTVDFTYNDAGNSVTAAVIQSALDHGSISGLSDDDHTQYALLAGRSGGQTLNGGTGSGNNLTLSTTSNATKGKIFFGTASAYDQANDRFGIGNTSPGVPLAFAATTGQKMLVYPSTSTTGYGFGIQFQVFQIHASLSTDRVGLGYGTSGSFTETLSVVGSNVGIGTITPQSKSHLHVGSATTISQRITNSSTGSTTSDGFEIGIDGVGVAEIRQRENSGIRFYCNNTLYNYITNIGTFVSTPSTSLASTCVQATFSDGDYSGEKVIFRATNEMYNTVATSGTNYGVKSNLLLYALSANHTGATNTAGYFDARLGETDATVTVSGEMSGITAIASNDDIASTTTVAKMIGVKASCESLSTTNTDYGYSFYAYPANVNGTGEEYAAFKNEWSAVGSGYNRIYGAYFIEPEATGTYNRSALRVDGTYCTTLSNNSATGTQNAFAIKHSYIKLDGATAPTFNGLTHGASGKRVTIHNKTGGTVTFNHESGSATAADRINTATGAAITVADEKHADLIYDEQALRWILLYPEA